MRQAFLFLFVVALSLWFAAAACAGAISVAGPWIPEAPPNAKALAAYMTIANASPDRVSLETASSPDFKRVEIHMTDMSHGMAHMVKKKNLPIEAGASVLLKPGSYHLMLMEPVRALHTGDTVSLQLIFDNGEAIDVKAVVRKQE
jgi:copper(I)-binding protein